MSKNYEVYGTYRRSSTPNFWRLLYLDIFDKVNLIPADVTDMASILETITKSEPDEIYNLAAQSFVMASFEKPLLTCDVDGLGTTRILECIRIINKKIKFYQASTSELYGNSPKIGSLMDENTRMSPASPYAAAKIYSYHTVNIYREAYGLFASNGILFNHESPIRGLEFVTRKVTNAVAQIKLGLTKKLTLGNLDSMRDWGYAEEYVEAMWRILQAEEPDDFVVATGEAHSVRELVEASFSRVNLDWKEFVEIDKRYLRPIDVGYLMGDSTKLEKKLKWKPKMKFNELIQLMTDEDLSRWENCNKGKMFPWDAPNYPDDSKLIYR